jgi:hypothetical protein
VAFLGGFNVFLSTILYKNTKSYFFIFKKTFCFSFFSEYYYGLFIKEGFVLILC